MVNIWGQVGAVAGFLPMSALTGTAGQLLGMNAGATLAEWKNVTFNTATSQLAVPNGLVGAPSYIFAGDVDTGRWHPGADQLEDVVAGVAVVNYNANRALFSKTLQITGKVIQEDFGADIVAAATTDLGTATGNVLKVTNVAGATVITSLGGATIPAGAEIETIISITGGSISITHDPVALILLGGANLPLQNGDVIRWRKINDASAFWQMVGFQRGTNSSTLTTKGDLLVGLGGGIVDRLPVPADGFVWTAQAAQPTGWIAQLLPAGGSPVPQAINSAILDSNGYNNALTVGAGLRPGLTASATDPYTLIFGATGLQETFTANIADILGVDLPASNTSYIYRTRGIAWKSTLVPKQESYAFDRSKQALLNFEGINGAVTTTDDFGNTWTLTTNTISTAQFKFGTSSQLCVVGGVCSSLSFTSQGDSSWQEELWFRPTTVGVAQVLLTKYNAGNFGIDLRITAGNVLSLSLSSTGAANDIAAASLGATALLINTWYKVRIVFDALAGTYRVYLSNNGANETQEINIASALKICAYVTTRIGNDNGLATGARGNIDAYRFLPCATKTVAEVPAIVAPTITDYTVTFVQISLMKMFEVTAASLVSGTNPTLTAANDLFLGEADTNGGGITTIRNYALRSEYISPLYGLALGINYSNNHNLGVRPLIIDTVLVNQISEHGFSPGEEAHGIMTHSSSADSVGIMTSATARNSIVTTTGSTKIAILSRAVPGSAQFVTVANWKLRSYVKRG